MTTPHHFRGEHPNPDPDTGTVDRFGVLTVRREDGTLQVGYLSTARRPNDDTRSDDGTPRPLRVPVADGEEDMQ
jgi:hypothetical protein